jgi:hypothetical protein
MNEFPPPAHINNKKKSSLPAKAFILFICGVAVIAGISLIGSNATANEKKANPVETGVTLGIGAGADAADELSYLDPSGLAEDALNAVDEYNATTTTEAPATTAPATTAPATTAPATTDPIITDEDMAMITWAGTALPAMQHIVDISGTINEDSDLTEMLTACIELGGAGQDLAVGAPANTAGDEALAIAESFEQASIACTEGDFLSATSYLEDGVNHLTALSTELDKWADS